MLSSVVAGLKWTRPLLILTKQRNQLPLVAAISLALVMLISMS